MGGGNLRIFPKPLHLPVTFPWLCNLPHRHKDNCPIQAVIHATPLWNMAAGSTDNTAPALIPTNPGRRWWSPACAWPSLAHLLTPHAPDKITHFDVFQMKIFSQSLQTQQDWMGKEGRQPTSQVRNTILCAPHRVLWGHEPPQLQPSCLVSWGSEAAAAAYTYVGLPGKMCTNLCYLTWAEELTHWPCGQAWWWGMLFGANQLKPRAPGTRITKMQKTVNRLYISLPRSHLAISFVKQALKHGCCRWEMQYPVSQGLSHSTARVASAPSDSCRQRSSLPRPAMPAASPFLYEFLSKWRKSVLINLH